MQGAFLYYFPNMTAAKLSREWLKTSPVSDQFRDCWERSAGYSLLSWVDVTRGPDGMTGVCFAAAPADGQPVGHKPERQTWIDCGSYWLGIDNEFRPGPDSLMRRKLIAGIDDELADGNVWHLPVVARPSEPDVIPWQIALPNIVRSADIATGGVRLAERYRAVWAETSKLIDWRLLGIDPKPTKAETYLWALQIAALLLGLNYRVGVHEIDALELFEDEDFAKVLNVAIDLDLVNEIVAARNRGEPTDPTEPQGSPSS